MLRYLLIGMGMLWGTLNAQGIFVSRYIPGNYLADNRHLVEIYNPGNRNAKLEGFILVTRDYSVRFPASVRIPPRSVFAIRKQQEEGLALSLQKTPDFIIRFRMQDQEGNYVALFNRNGKLVDAMYFSPIPNVRFLPDRDTCITFAREKIPYYLPPENRAVWTYVSVAEHNKNEFVQRNGEWKLSGDPELLPATSYSDFSLKYNDDIVTIKWSTEYEKDCREHVVERSMDSENFNEVIRIEPAGPRTYTHYDLNLATEEDYFYRIRTTDIYGQTIYSQIREIRTEEAVEQFKLDVFYSELSAGSELNLRFTSREDTPLRLKLYDENMLEIAILFNDTILSEIPNLLKISASLDPGRKYLILADTEMGRFGKEIRIPE